MTHANAPGPNNISWNTLTSKRDVATALAEAGFSVVPLPPNQKAPPALKGWQSAPPLRRKDVEKLWTGSSGESTDNNIAIVTGRGLIVLDFDAKKGGLESYFQLTVLEDRLPATFHVATQGGGYHVYLSTNDCEIASSVDVLDRAGLPGVDLRATGGYVVASGSSIDGRHYRAVNDRPIAKAPQWLIAALRQQRPRQKTEQTPVAEVDSDEGIALAREWLTCEAPEGLQGSRNDTAARIIAPKLKDFGLSPDRSVEIADEHWNATRVEPPLDADELEAAITSGYRSATKHPPGIAIAELAHHEFGEPLPPEYIDAIERQRNPLIGTTRARAADIQAPSPSTYKPIDWGACEGDPPVLGWVWQNLIPQGHVTTLFGDGGTGKTLLAQQLATMIAMPGHRRPLEQDGLLGHSVEPGRVVALFCEDDENELWRRQVKINNALNLNMRDLSNFTAFSGYGRDNLLVHFDQNTAKPTSGLEHLRAACKARRPSLVVIDNIADTFGGDEIRRVHVNQFLKTYLGGIANDFGCAVLLLGHPSNTGLASGSGISGNRAWSNGVRSRLFMRRLGEDDPSPDPNGRILELMKANYAPTGTWVRVTYQDGLWVPVLGASGGAEPVGSGTQRDVVLDVMKRLVSQGRNLSPNTRAGNDALKQLMRTDDVAALRMTRDQLGRAIDGLMTAGEIHLQDYKGENRTTYQRYAIGSRESD